MPTTEAEPLSPTLAARALVEALPFLHAWAGRTVVVKYGGAAMKDGDLEQALIQDLVLLLRAGVRVVLVHGGGARVSAVGARMGLEPRFVDGLRVTDEATMEVAQMVQVGRISRDICAAVARQGGRAVGLSGQDGGGWLRGTRREHRSRETGQPVDLGRVGDISAVDASLPRALLEAGLLPVVAPVAVDDALGALNVNADSVATAVAKALGAAKLIFLSDVPGIRGPEGEVVPQVSAATLRAWIERGVVLGGMIPKAEACLDALDAGVGGVCVADGRVPHAALLELLTPAGQGTLVTAEDA